jgi:hypothetical protein
MDKVPRNARPKLSVAPIFEYSLRAPAPGVKIFGLRRRASQGMVFPAAQISKAAGASVTRGRQYVSRCNESALLPSLVSRSFRPSCTCNATHGACEGRPAVPGTPRRDPLRPTEHHPIPADQPHLISRPDIFIFNQSRGRKKRG